jgi:hypothetical protein
VQVLFSQKKSEPHRSADTFQKRVYENF